MKKKILFFSNGWSAENVNGILTGLFDALPPNSYDIFNFTANNYYAMTEDETKSEISIYSLPDYASYDAAIVFVPSLNSNEAKEIIYEKCQEADIPTILIGDKHPGFFSISVDNIIGMRELCRHVMDGHDATKVKFIAGSADNIDSNTRINVVCEEMRKRDLEFSVDRDVFYSNWDVKSTIDFISDNFKSKESLPDIFICANDTIAIAACIGLEINGFSVPYDTMVTGFDLLMASLSYYPAIASVSQHFDFVGKRCAKLLKEIFENNAFPSDSLTPSEFFPSESCGCSDSQHEDNERRMFVKNNVYNRFEESNTDGRYREIEVTFLKADRYDKLPQLLQPVILQKNDAEGATFELMLDPNLEQIAETDLSELPKYTYPETFKIIAAKINGKPVTLETCTKKQLIPGYKGLGPNHVYFIMPIYIESFVCGYMVTMDNLKELTKRRYPLLNQRLLKTMTIFRTSLKMAALNAKLAVLMQTDALTSLKNRTAFENTKQTIQSRINSGETPTYAIAMFDVNNLKEVNDILGHKMGDIYIKNACAVICTTFKHSPVFRIGGDEFVAIVSNSDYKNREHLMTKFRESVSKVSYAATPDVNNVSIASGIADFNMISGNDFDAVLKIADEEMYKNKKEMKAKAKKLQDSKLVSYKTN